MDWLHLTLAALLFAHALYSVRVISGLAAHVAQLAAQLAWTGQVYGVQPGEPFPAAPEGAGDQPAPSRFH